MADYMAGLEAYWKAETAIQKLSPSGISALLHAATAFSNDGFFNSCVRRGLYPPIRQFDKSLNSTKWDEIEKEVPLREAVLYGLSPLKADSEGMIVAYEGLSTQAILEMGNRYSPASVVRYPSADSPIVSWGQDYEEATASANQLTAEAEKNGAKFFSGLVGLEAYIALAQYNFWTTGNTLPGNKCHLLLRTSSKALKQEGDEAERRFALLIHESGRHLTIMTTKDTDKTVETNKMGVLPVATLPLIFPGKRELVAHNCLGSYLANPVLP